MKKEDQPNFTELQNNQVQNLPSNFSEESFIEWGSNQQNVDRHNSSFLQIKGEDFTGIGPIEKNPNIDRHIDDFDLTREFLMLGPFPSSQYLTNPDLLEYFYADNLELWDYLFELVDSAVTVDNIKKALRKRSISITDVFAFVQRKSFTEVNPNDNFSNIVLNKRIAEVFQTGSLTHTILTFSGHLKELKENTKKSNTTGGLFWVLEEFIGLENLEISGSLTGEGQFYPFNKKGINNSIKQQDGRITWWMKKGDKKIKIQSLPTPSEQNNQSIPTQEFCKRWLDYKADLSKIDRREENQKARDYVNNYPNIFKNKYTKQYRRDVYAKALDDTLHEI